MKLFIRVIIINLVLLSCLNSTELVEKVYNKNFYQYDHYFKKYSKMYNIPFLLLKAIALTENSPLNAHLVCENKNKSKDLGLMQINTIHLNEMGIKPKHLLNPDINIHVAAILLSDLIKKYGYSWDSIGKYHSRTMKHKRKWVKKVKKHITNILKYDKKHHFETY